MDRRQALQVTAAAALTTILPQAAVASPKRKMYGWHSILARYDESGSRFMSESLEIPRLLLFKIYQPYKISACYQAPEAPASIVEVRLNPLQQYEFRTRGRLNFQNNIFLINKDGSFLNPRFGPDAVVSLVKEDYEIKLASMEEVMAFNEKHPMAHTKCKYEYMPEDKQPFAMGWSCTVNEPVV